MFQGSFMLQHISVVYSFLWLNNITLCGYASFPGGSVVKNLPTNAGDVGSAPGLGRSPGEGNDDPLQYSCLGNPMDRGAQWAIIHGVTRIRHDLVTKPPPPLTTIHVVYMPYLYSTWFPVYCLHLILVMLSFEV